MNFTLDIMLMNLFYAVGGSAIALFFMILGYKIFDRITPFDTALHLKEGNIAIGIVVGSIFLSIGVSVGLVVGLGLN